MEKRMPVALQAIATGICDLCNCLSRQKQPLLKRKGTYFTVTFIEAE